MIALLGELIRIGLLVFFVTLVWRMLFGASKKQGAQKAAAKNTTARRFDAAGKNIKDADFKDVSK